MSYITSIIIVLIIVSIMVTVTEVAIRFGMLSKAKGTGIDPAIIVPALGDGVSGQGHVALPPSDLEILAQTLGLQSNASFDDVQQSILALQEKTLPDASFVHDSHEDV